jgi:cellulose synthase/poly-beta-1,6-N-acetylglucosamine synthase-like glycosyltransferase
MQNYPFVSLLMPVRNEASFIERSLGAVLTQDYPRDRIEVIVADGLSTDSTREIIDALAKEHPNLRVIDNPGMIVATGLNAALGVARGEVVIRVDGHTVIAPDYCRQCVEALRQTGADNVGGRMSAVSDGVFGRAVALATSSRFGIGDARFHYSDREELVDTVYLGAWRRDVFQRVGMFDEEMVRNQDDEFNYRLRAAGGKILLNPRIKSEYYNRANAFSLWRQYFQYGYWKVRVLQKHPRQMAARQFVPPLFVTTLFFLCVTSPFFIAGRLLLATAAISYSGLSLGASILAARRNNWRLLPVLPIVFAIIHFAYGSGFLLGLARFWNRWRDHGSRSSQSTLLRDVAPLQ